MRSSIGLGIFRVVEKIAVKKQLLDLEGKRSWPTFPSVIATVCGTYAAVQLRTESGLDGSSSITRPARRRITCRFVAVTFSCPTIRVGYTGTVKYREA